ncbi:hypothetical protein RB195_003319 [Necator americanus]|uniref:Uncharacterized protein n=1 Tax=Necator americanus TaxID=51031 RepID=A0ABR1DMZ4_NECAM
MHINYTRVSCRIDPTIAFGTKLGPSQTTAIGDGCQQGYHHAPSHYAPPKRLKGSRVRNCVHASCRFDPTVNYGLGFEGLICMDEESEYCHPINPYGQQHPEFTDITTPQDLGEQIIQFDIVSYIEIGI